MEQLRQRRIRQKKPIQWNFILLAFLAPVFGMFVVMLVRGFIPFGDTSMLYSDMYHQYYPFFVAFRKALLSGDSLLYNWSVGMGMDYLGLVSYYLASPLNLLSVLVPESWLLGYFSLLVPIKLGFAGMFFAVFLKKLFRRDDFSLTVFGALYGLCAWALGYQWNVMWLDTFALLPLVALGTVRLLERRKFVLYTLTLFLSVFCNYYIGLFTCIFVALVFFCYEICRWRGFRRFLSDLLCIALFSALAIGMTAILTLPAYAALQTTQSSVNKFPKDFRLNIADENTWKGLLDAMRQVAGNMNGSLSPTFKEGLPNLYCGVITSLLAILYLTCRQVKKRDRVCAVFLLLFFNVSFIIRQLDYIWHGFHFTNMIPYRFSFLYSFVMLYMAYRAWLLRNRFRVWQPVTAGILATVLAFLSEKQGLLYWLYNGILLAVYFLLLLLPCFTGLKKKDTTLRQRRRMLRRLRRRRRTAATILLIVMVAELGLSLGTFGYHFTGTTVTNYPRGTKYTDALIDYMYEREEDNLFFRAETTHSQTLNDGALNGYNGISTFTSSANVKVTEFMKTLGYGAKNTYNRYCYEESSPVANLFLNLKYMLERQNKVEENFYFTEIHQYGSVHLLENAAYLPLGFLADNQLVNVDFTGISNTFSFQNELFTGATGVTGEVWSLITGTDLAISGTEVTVNSQTQTGYCAYTTDADKGGIITYRYTVPKEGLVCIDLNLSKKNKFSFWKNGTELYNETYSLPQSLSVSHCLPGDVIEVQLTCNAGERGTITLHAGLLNEDVFWAGYDVLNASTLTLTEFKNTYVAGEITCNRNGVLYTSIPQDGNWSAWVDGMPADIVLIGDAMVGLLLSEGEHTVTFRYKNSAFHLGAAVSALCLAVFLVLYFCIYKPRLPKGKYERTT
ncbi:MAG: YfhO family protein [Oscillospiraceae bacterium]|nr:YfhO family protein [Oscillospiraceae bacterium]